MKYSTVTSSLIVGMVLLMPTDKNMVSAAGGKENTKNKSILKMSKQEEKLSTKHELGLMKSEKYYDRICQMADDCENKLNTKKNKNKSSKKYHEKNKTCERLQKKCEKKNGSDPTTLAPTTSPTTSPTETPESQWYLGENNESCVATCNRYLKSCNVVPMQLVDSEAKMDFVAQLIGIDCANNGGFWTSTDDEDLPAWYLPTNTYRQGCGYNTASPAVGVTCTMLYEEAQRFCCCGSYCPTEN